ncbi:MAG: hypothetical protein MUE54_05125 [Anaerolineae bacterium]|nr:hypothetical protein [Anaerolineae bacterium]
MISQSDDKNISPDFNFLLGRWRVENKMLPKRLEGSDDWKTFEATQECTSVLGGVGVIDEMIHTEGTSIGMSLRFFNRETQQWFIYWVSYRDGVMQPPVTGNFKDGEGIFEGADIWNGTPIIVRFRWTNTDTPTPRWEQFFSSDNGQTWEKNWEMNFTRI